MKRILLFLSTVALVAGGCSSKPGGNTASTPTPKPSGSTTSAAPKANEKKPPATNPVPSDWVRMYNDTKGYEFYVPAGTKDASQTVEGVDVYLASVPAPYEIGVMVVAFKDAKIGKDDLIKRAENVLKAFGEKDIKMEPAKELNGVKTRTLRRAAGSSSHVVPVPT